MHPISITQLLDASADLLPQSTHVDQAQIIWALCKIGMQPPPRLLSELVKCSLPLLRSMSFLSLETLLTCLARLDFRSGISDGVLGSCGEGYCHVLTKISYCIARPPNQWLEEAALAVTHISCSPRTMTLPLRLRARITDRASFALEQLSTREGSNLMCLHQSSHDTGIKQRR